LSKLSRATIGTLDWKFDTFSYKVVGGVISSHTQNGRRLYSAARV
jgi:hypothetical protein